MENKNEMPLIMNVDDISRVLGVSRSTAYAVMKSEGFPLLRVGNRFLVTSDRFWKWIDAHAGDTNLISIPE